MRFPRLALACAFMLVSGAAQAAPERAGYYENLRYITEVDDYVGVRMTVSTGPAPSVDFELCQGWCNGSEVFPAVIDGDRIAFTYVSRGETRDGQVVTHATPVTGRFVRGGVILTIGDGEPEKLRRRRSIPR
jgi:hypothetical protein